ncbi:TonB-dependent receptor [Sphingomonas segetis]|jgi:outer membrane receptor protein involved in Fe transport|uniref:TonB-dependent receptor n=1 Tax=Sphingomonas segetis TaxID=1104779 RepID=UPI0012D317E4|nr:TonB-dependent receptor [Sphingomonas segetis]
MTDSSIRAITLGLLATTALASPAFAQTPPPVDATPATETTQSPAPGTNATDVTAPPPQVQKAQAGQVQDQTEIVITATKREEFLQDVPMSVRALGTRRLDQLNISNFEEYTKQLPSVSFNTSQSGGTVVYMRGVATGGDGNHSGSLPSVGVYLDEQPVTTIGGALDVHIYDIARIESLAGPQGTLYGASSEAGTIRIITNKPDLSGIYGRIDGEVNKVAHGDMGGKLEGMINVPIAPSVAFRGVAFWQRDAGFIDNVPGTRTFCGSKVLGPDGDDDNTDPDVVGCVRNGISVNNAAFVRDDINEVTTYGGRAALKVDLDENWVVTPTIMHQYYKQDGFYAFDPTLGDLNVQRFRGDEYRRDKFTQAALTIEGKLADFDVTYAGAWMNRPTYSLGDYTDYTDAYDRIYENKGGLANYEYFYDSAGDAIDPRQYIIGTEHFKKMSHEVRIATPQDWRARAIVGAFYQRQKNHIYQNYLVDNLAPELSVNGWPGTVWLTLQDREDKDYALFGEGEFDVTPQVTLIAGGRLFRYDNSLFGFAGFGRNPAFTEENGFPPPPNAIGASSGVRRCLTVNGLESLADEDSELAPGGVAGTPCTNVGNVVNGRAVPRESKGHGFTHRLSARYKPAEHLMFYATWSRGFRPGGINRQPNAPAYDPDYLTNYELGWKTSFGPVTWNGAVYHQIWKKFQFSFLGENSLTVIQNGRDAKIDGLETDLSYVHGGLSLNAAAAFTDAKTSGAICHSSVDPSADCSAPGDWIVTPDGTRLPITPKFKGTATARYSWPMWLGKAHVQGSVTHQGSASVDVRRDADGEGSNPNDVLGKLHSSTLVDLFFGYDWQNYSAELFATNLFDERNELSRFVACSVCTVAYVLPGRPRTFGLRLGTRF